MSPSRLTSASRRDLETFAKSLVETCMRNSELENLHAGIAPSSATGDYTDVKVVTPNGEIPWAGLSRISDVEMKALMIDVVDRVYTYLRYPEHLAGLGSAIGWDRPKLHPDMMEVVRRKRGRAEIDV